MKLILFEYLFHLFEFYTNRYYSWNNDRMILTRYWNSGSKDIKIADLKKKKKEIQKEFLRTELLLISNGVISDILL